MEYFLIFGGIYIFGVVATLYCGIPFLHVDSDDMIVPALAWFGAVPLFLLVAGVVYSGQCIEQQAKKDREKALEKKKKSKK